MDCRRPGSSVLGILQARILSGLPQPLPGYILNSGIKLACLLHCRWILYPLSHLGSPKWLCNKGLYPRLQCALKWVTAIFPLLGKRNASKRSGCLFWVTLWILWYSRNPGSSFCSVAKLCPTLCDPMDCSAPGFPVLHYLPEFAQTLVHWLGDAILPSHSPTISLLLPSIFLSIRVFSNESALRIRWPNNWNFSFASVLLVNIQGWFPLGLAGLISLLSKGFSRVFSNITVWKHQFFGVQPSLWSNSHLYMTTGKTIALTIWNFADKVLPFFFNMLSRFVIVFFPRCVF